jgi:hypothetical protein
VLVTSQTAGFRHAEAIAAGRAVLRDLDRADPGLRIRFTEDARALEDLAPYRAVVFLHTSGELPLSAAARAGLIRFVRGGGGFVGTHSATDTLYSFPGYGRLVGTSFREHPNLQGTMRVARAHPLTRGLPRRLGVRDEIYEFRGDPRAAGARVLVTVDPVGPTGPLPSAWCRTEGAGRVAYIALGHRPEVVRSGWYRRQLANAIGWAVAPGARC